MGLELKFSDELLVTRAEFENQCFEHDKGFADHLMLTLEVKTAITRESTRELTGHVMFVGSFNYQPAEFKQNYHGSWTFYAENDFGAYVFVPPEQIERMWTVLSGKHESFVLTISEGPEVFDVGKDYEGKFRFGYRAGLTSDDPTRAGARTGSRNG